MNYAIRAAQILYVRMIAGFFAQDRHMEHKTKDEYAAMTVACLQVIILNFIFALMLVQFGVLSRFKKITMCIHSILATGSLFSMLYGQDFLIAEDEGFAKHSVAMLSSIICFNIYQHWLQTMIDADEELMVKVFQSFHELSIARQNESILSHLEEGIIVLNENEISY